MTQTSTFDATEPTTMTQTVTATATPEPTTTTTTMDETVTNVVTTFAGPTTTATFTKTSTSQAVRTTTATVTTTTTTTTTVTVPSPTYSLAWDKDTCGYAYPNIVDFAFAGAEEDVVTKCANLCTAQSNCKLWEAYYYGNMGRCATFKDGFNRRNLVCPHLFGIGYSVGAQKVA